MDGEDYRTGSADSENGSDNSYVQVSSEDVPASESQPLVDIDELPVTVDNSGVPAVDDDEDIYGDDAENEETTDKVPPVVDSQTPPSDPFFGGNFIESKEEPAPVEPKSPEVTSRVEEVPTVTSKPEAKKTTDIVVPGAKGYLCFLNMLHPLILYMVYWRDLKLSAVVLGVNLVILLTLTLNTLLHTIVLFLLSFLVVSLTYIVSKIVIDSFYNKEVKNPFSDYLNKKITLPEEKILDWTRYAIERADRRFNRLVRLLLFDNIKQSLKFGVSLWLLSFVSNCCSVLSIMFTLVVLLFSVPPLYERFQPVIDSNIGKATKVLVDTYTKVKAKIPYIGKSKSD